MKNTNNQHLYYREELMKAGFTTKIVVQSRGVIKLYLTNKSDGSLASELVIKTKRESTRSFIDLEPIQVKFKTTNYDLKTGPTEAIDPEIRRAEKALYERLPAILEENQRVYASVFNIQHTSE